MAAPVPTPRTTPTAKKPGAGFKIVITFALDPDIEFWEKSVNPSGLDGGDPIDTTTQHNIKVRTKAPRPLIDNTDITATVTYNPVVYGSIRNLINKPTTVTTHWWDGSSYAQYGFLRSFTPGGVGEDGNPEADIAVVITNQDPATGAEEEGVYTPPAPGFMGFGIFEETDGQGEEQPEAHGEPEEPQALQQADPRGAARGRAPAR